MQLAVTFNEEGVRGNMTLKDKALNQEAWSENAPLNDGSQNVRTGLQVSTSKRKLVWEEVSLKNILKPITLTVSLLIVL